jgi:hypothetical protein
MKLKSGKDEIIYLLEKAIEKFEKESGKEIKRNSNRQNYEPLARVLSDISNNLPNTAAQLGHIEYPPDYNPKKPDYPFRKYDITGNQIKDAYFLQIVFKPRPFLVDACYIYLYGKGRLGFADMPADDNLLLSTDVDPADTRIIPHRSAFSKRISKRKIPVRLMLAGLIVFFLTSILLGFLFFSRSASWQAVKGDMKILPYKVSQAEIDSLEGVWLCYTGSPQARISEANRYHLVVSNVVDIKFKNGYFVFTRYGASFDHEGFAQFESPWMVSIHSYVKNNSHKIESPRHSLMRLDGDDKYISVISASWNFDVGSKNNIIGIREVYIKQGKGGQIEEVMNTIENSGCKCKIIKWHQANGGVKVFQLKNELLDNLPDLELKRLLDEKSILLRVPNDGLLLADSVKSKKD